MGPWGVGATPARPTPPFELHGRSSAVAVCAAYLAFLHFKTEALIGGRVSSHCRYLLYFFAADVIKFEENRIALTTVNARVCSKVSEKYLRGLLAAPLSTPDHLIPMSHVRFV